MCNFIDMAYMQHLMIFLLLSIFYLQMLVQIYVKMK